MFTSLQNAMRLGLIASKMFMGSIPAPYRCLGGRVLEDTVSQRSHTRHYLLVDECEVLTQASRQAHHGRHLQEDRFRGNYMIHQHQHENGCITTRRV